MWMNASVIHVKMVALVLMTSTATPAHVLNNMGENIVMVRRSVKNYMMTNILTSKKVKVDLLRCVKNTRRITQTKKTLDLSAISGRNTLDVHYNRFF